MQRAINDRDTATTIKLWEAGKSGREIAETLGIRSGTAYARIAHLERLGKIAARGHGGRAQSSRTAEALEQLPALWKQPLTLEEMAQRIGYSTAQTYNLARKVLGLPARRRVRLPVEVQRHKAAHILRRDGWGFHEIGEVLQITRQRAHQLWKTKLE